MQKVYKTIFVVFLGFCQTLVAADPVLVGLRHMGNIFCSENGGKDWIRVNGNYKQVEVANDGSLWAVTRENEVLFSKDGGKTWQTSTRGISQIALSPDDTVWGIKHDTRQLYHAVQGKDWAQLKEAAWENLRGNKGTSIITARTIAVGPDGQLWIVSNSHGWIVKSSDNGKSWRDVIDENQGDHARLLVGLDKNHTLWRYFVDSGDTYRSLDLSKKTWEKLPQKFSCLVYAKDQELWGIGKLDGKIWSSKDNGKTWQDLPVKLVYLAVAPNDKCVPAKDVAFEAKKDTAEKINAEALNVLIGLAANNEIFISKNGGNEWIKRNGLAREAAIGYNGFLWVIGVDKKPKLSFSGDGADKWNSHGSLCEHVALGADDLVWNSDGMYLAYSSDKAVHWNRIGAARGDKVMNLAVDKDGTLWGISQKGTATFELFRTSDKGRNWYYADVSSILFSSDKGRTWHHSDVALVYIAVSPGGTLWCLGNDGSLFYSNSNGDSWEKSGDKKFTQIAIAADGSLWGINSAQEVFHSKDKGGNWEKIGGKFVFVATAPNDKVLSTLKWIVVDKEKEEAKKIKDELIKSKNALVESFKKTGAGDKETINTVLERLYKQAIAAKDVYVKSNTEFFAYLKSELKQDAVENNLSKTLTQAGEKLKAKIESIKKEAAQLKSEGEGLKKEGAALEVHSTALQAEGEKLGQKCNPFAQGAEVLTNIVGGLNAIKSGDPVALAESGLKTVEAYKDMGVAAAGLAMSLADKMVGNLGDLVGIKLSMPGMQQADIALGAAIKFTDDVTGGLGKLATGDFSGALSGFSSGLKGVGSGAAELVKSLKIDETAGMAKAAVEDAARAVGSVLSSAASAFNPGSW